MKRHGTAAVVVGALVLAGCGEPAGRGGDFDPTRATMVVPFGAGGGSDSAGRAIAAGFEEVSGTNISVENRDGGSGAVGYSYFLSKQGKGGYLLPAETAMLSVPLTQDVEYTYRDFTPIMKLADDFTVLTVPKSSKFTSCAQIVKAAKKERVVAAVSGATGHDNVVFKLVEQDKGVKFDRIPFESGSEVISALLGGRVEIASLNPSEVAGQIKSGDLKALCSFSEKRYTYDLLKDVPTAKEQGIDVAFAQFRGLIAPGGLSESDEKYWIDAGRKFRKTKGYRTYVEQNLLQPAPLYGDDFAKYIAANNSELEKAIG